MKKKEAQILAPQSTQVLLKEIEKIFMVEEPIQVQIDLDYERIEKKDWLIYVIRKPKEEILVLPTCISVEQASVLQLEILETILNQYLSSPFVMVSNFITFRGNNQRFDGIYLQCINGTKISLDLGPTAIEIKEYYTKRILAYRNSLDAATKKL